MTIAVVAVAGAGGAPLDEATRWYAAISGGRFAPTFTLLPPVNLPRPLAWYLPDGGMGRPPHNSQVLAGDTLTALDDHARAAVGELLLLIVPLGFRAHTWRLPGGGFHLGDGRFCHRYAVVPSGASLGTIAHELGHLLLDWPDLARDSRLGDDCLMALGAARLEPSPPCAPLALAAGWRTTFAVERETRVDALDGQRCGRFQWGGSGLLIERRAHRLLVYADPGPPCLLLRVALDDGDEERPLLAVLGRHLRALEPAMAERGGSGSGSR